tara:strand:+ start:283 stop:477 length:195 start_codon:yes stop_codon:yes gene_type:complete
MSLKSFVNNKSEWDSFCEEIDLWIADQHKRLEQAESVVEIHRSQGAIQSLRKLKYLRDKINGIK